MNVQEIKLSQIFFFLFLILLTPVSFAEAYNLNAVLLGEGQAGGNPDDEIITDNTPVDLSLNVVTVTETIETVGGEEVSLTQQTEFVATDGDIVTLINTAQPEVIVEIPDGAIVSANSTWDKTITPPQTVATGGTISGNFLTPTTALLVGSPDVILVFDKAVTIILEGVTGQTAYKTPGATEWILISICTGSYENPNNPPVNGECSISNDTDTKIVTYHFTEFAGLSSPAPSTPSAPSTTSSGGHGNTGVGSPRIFGPSSSGSSGGGVYYGPSDSGPRIFPTWFDNVTDWYREGKISALEFLNAYQWVIDNIMK